MKILSAHSPVYSDSTGVNIDLIIETDGFGDVPFTSSPFDDEQHGRELHAQALAGAYGPIAPYVAPVPTNEEKRQKIEKQRDITLAAGLTWNGNKYHIDQTMIAALNGRLTLWQEGKIAAGATLPVRRMDNVIELLDRAQHADLADALRLHGEAVYAASWVEKDKL